jgi:hypothetical protein
VLDVDAAVSGVYGVSAGHVHHILLCHETHPKARKIKEPLDCITVWQQRI